MGEIQNEVEKALKADEQRRAGNAVIAGAITGLIVLAFLWWIDVPLWGAAFMGGAAFVGMVAKAK